MKKLSPTLKNLIAILNDGQIHSGSSLGERLNISRNAIWKHINQLIKYDVPIKSVQSTGYQLGRPLVLLDAKNIKKNISYSGKLSLKKVEIFASVNSTNTYLQQHSIKELNTLQICLAELQTAGRGRLGRVWDSQFGTNIYLSFSWRIAKDMSELSGLSLVVAIALADALTEYGVTDIRIKWPNDILWHNQKLAGVLIDVTAESHGMTHIVVGIGLNVNMSPTTKKNIDQPWAALSDILGGQQDRNKITGILITHLLKNIEKFEQKGFSPFIKQWQRYDHLSGEKITLYSGNQTISGTVKGVNHQGFLLLQQADGSITAHSSGDTSTKKSNFSPVDG